MMRSKLKVRRPAALAAAATTLLAASTAIAQDSAPPSGGGNDTTGPGTAAGPGTGGGTGPGTSTGPGPAPGGGTGVSTGTARVGPPAPWTPPQPYAPGKSPESSLPSSSRPLAAGAATSDTFDLNTSSGTSTVHGAEDAQGVFESHPGRVPGVHVVRRGDTLWDITGYYYRNPWMWPKVWSYNPQIQNPHWIYPGDHLRLRDDAGDERPSQALGLGLVSRRPSVPSDTVFLRDEGYVDDERRDVWGVVSGSPEDVMLLTDRDEVYLELKKDHDVEPNQELTIFRPVRSVEGGKGAIVAIIGSVRVDTFDKDKRIAKGHIVESLDVIERGARVGPVGRRFDVVPPARNDRDNTAHVLAAVWPRVYHAQNQVVYIDKGSDDGLKPGNRLFVLRRGDPWRASLQSAGDLSDKSVRATSGLGPETETVRGTDRDKDYPDEVIGELRVLRTREKTAACLVTSSTREIVGGDLAVARKGY